MRHPALEVSDDEQNRRGGSQSRYEPLPSAGDEEVQDYTEREQSLSIVSAEEGSGLREKIIKFLNTSTRFTLYLKYDLRLMSSVKDVNHIPRRGKNLIILADVDQVLHFRVFDGDGNVLVENDEKRLTEKGRQIEDLRTQLASLWPPHKLDTSEKARIDGLRIKTWRRRAKSSFFTQTSSNVSCVHSRTKLLKVKVKVMQRSSRIKSW